MSTPALAATRVRQQARWETLTLLRNGEQLLVSIVLPLIALVGLSTTSFLAQDDRAAVDIAAPGVLALAVASSAFTAQAISTAFDRRYGVLRMFGVSPLGRGGLLIGKLLAVVTVLALQFLVLGGVAFTFGWRPVLAGLVPAAFSIVLGAAAFLGLALLLAGTIRAEAVLAIANLLWVVFLGLGLLLPLSRLPGWAQGPAGLLPSGSLGEALRSSLIDGTWPLGSWAVLLVWAVLTWALALRLFRWAP